MSAQPAPVHDVHVPSLRIAPETQLAAAGLPLEVQCPACGASAQQPGALFEFQTARGKSPWTRCTDCQTYFLLGEYEIQTEADHTRQMAWGRKDAGTELNDFKRKMFLAALDGAERHGHSAGSILDVGCSFGGFLIEAQKRGFSGAGVDIVPEAVDHVQSLGFVSQRCASLTECTLFSNARPVDVVSVLDAHIYWPNQPGELLAAWKLLRPGGLLIIRALTKSPFITAGRLLSLIAPQTSKKLIRRAITDHRFSMPLKSLLRVVESSGFEILEASPRGAQHSDGSPLSVKAAFGIGTLTWHTMRIPLAPGAMIFARKPAE